MSQSVSWCLGLLQHCSSACCRRHCKSGVNFRLSHAKKVQQGALEPLMLPWVLVDDTGQHPVESALQRPVLALDGAVAHPRISLQLTASVLWWHTPNETLPKRFKGRPTVSVTQTMQGRIFGPALDGPKHSCHQYAIYHAMNAFRYAYDASLPQRQGCAGSKYTQHRDAWPSGRWSAPKARLAGRLCS
jgi:hypothetical protein